MLPPVILISQLLTVRPREKKGIGEDHTTSEGQRQESNLAGLGLTSVSLSAMPTHLSRADS